MSNSALALPGRLFAVENCCACAALAAARAIKRAKLEIDARLFTEQKHLQSRSFLVRVFDGVADQVHSAHVFQDAAVDASPVCDA